MRAARDFPKDFVNWLFSGKFQPASSQLATRQRPEAPQIGRMFDPFGRPRE
jgi:hypothetical protein